MSIRIMSSEEYTNMCYLLTALTCDAWQPQCAFTVANTLGFWGKEEWQYDFAFSLFVWNVAAYESRYGVKLADTFSFVEPSLRVVESTYAESMGLLTDILLKWQYQCADLADDFGDTLNEKFPEYERVEALIGRLSTHILYEQGYFDAIREVITY